MWDFRRMSLFKFPKHTFIVKIHLSGTGRVGVLKTFSWKSKMKNVVKYDVYLDIWRMLSISVIQYRMLRENPET